MKPLKVVQVITGLGAGGAERLLLDMQAAFRPDHVDTKLVSISRDTKGLEVYGHRDVSVEIFDLAANRLRALRDLRRYLRHAAPDVIHAHMFHALVAVVLAQLGLTGPRPAIVFTSHLGGYSPLRSAITRILRYRRAADIIFAPGQHPELNARHVEVIANGVPIPDHPVTRRIWAPDGPVRFVAVGRLADQKDPLGLLRSFAAADLAGATLDILGAGPLLGEAQALATTLGIKDRVTFHGLRSDVAHILAMSDVFVMHSRYEGMPMALLEAAAQAMPVVATPVGSVPDILGDGRGILADPSGFADALRKVAGDAASALGMGQRLYLHARSHYSIAATSMAHERLYATVASRHASR